MSEEEKTEVEEQKEEEPKEEEKEEEEEEAPAETPGEEEPEEKEEEPAEEEEKAEEKKEEPREERFGGRQMFKATCADCGKECEVPFKPTEGRPVYCRDCFRKHRPERRGPPRRW